MASINGTAIKNAEIHLGILEGEEEEEEKNNGEAHTSVLPEIVVFLLLRETELSSK